MKLLRVVLFQLLLVGCAGAAAQEIKWIDLATIQQHTELRYPPAPPSNCEEGKSCVGGGSVGAAISDGAPDRRDPRALGVYLVHVKPTEINPAEPFEAEFRVVNTGLAPIELPISPHLSDLQPPDESATFDYFSLALVVEVRGVPPVELVSFAYVELYGSPDHEGTMLALKPGEWIRVRAKVKFHSWPQGPVAARFRGQFWFRSNTYHPHPGGQFTEMRNLYPNPTPTPWIVFQLLRPTRSEEPKPERLE